MGALFDRVLGAYLGLALGDALAAALMTKRGFGAADFARFHPAGQLGRNLLLTVGEALQPLERCAQVAPGTSLRDTVIGSATASCREPLGPFTDRFWPSSM